MTVFLKCYGLWCLLGFYRGIQDYNNTYNNKYKFYMKNSFIKKPNYYYTEMLKNAVLGLIAYAFPITLPIFVITELYKYLT